MRMEAMVEARTSFEQDDNAHQLSFEEKLALMMDQQWTSRQNLALERRLLASRISTIAPARGLDKSIVVASSQGSTLKSRQDLLAALISAVRSGSADRAPRKQVDAFAAGFDADRPGKDRDRSISADPGEAFTALSDEGSVTTSHCDPHD